MFKIRKSAKIIETYLSMKKDLNEIKIFRKVRISLDHDVSHM